VEEEKRGSVTIFFSFPSPISGEIHNKERGKKRGIGAFTSHTLFTLPGDSSLLHSTSLYRKNLREKEKVVRGGGKRMRPSSIFIPFTLI